jgi:peptide/nickel transport system substrate-binding protein
MQKIIALICVLTLLGCSAQQPASEDVPIKQTLTPEYGGTLKIYSYNFDTLNPLFTKSKANRQMLMLIYDFLIVCDSEQRPSLALASGFQISDDALTWTINIKTGVKWHDGSDLTVNDVIQTLSAVKVSPHSSPYKDNLNNVEKIEESDGSVVITLKAPQTNFINLLEIPVVKASDAFEFNIERPVGTGCYLYAEKTHKVIYLTSNKAGEKIPYIESIEVYLLPDKSTSVYAFQAKEIDVVATDMENRGDFSGYSQSKSVEFNSGGYNFIAFNLENEYFSNGQVRKAFAHAINKNRIFEEVMLSYGSLCDTFINPNWWLYNDSVPKYEFNPSLAVNMLEEQKLTPDSIDVSLLVNEDNIIKINTANIIVQQLRAIGINANIKPVSWEAFKSFVAKGEYDMYLGQINYSPEINPEYTVPDISPFSSILPQLQTQLTDEGRKAIYHQLQQEYAEFLPAIPLYFNAETILLSNRINGEIHPVRNNIFNNIHQWFITNQ